jgi:hypothetical protein
MEIQADYRELFESFNSHGVEFLVVGAYALGFHGHPRYTGDIDILLGISGENPSRILKALESFGFGSLGLTEADFRAPDQVVQLGVPPVRADLLTSISGVSWDEALAGSVAGDYGGIPVRYLGRAELIRNKKATGRMKDLSDLESLAE